MAPQILILLFLGLALAVLVVIAVNVAVDPLAQFGVTKMRPVVWPSRRVKTAMIVSGPGGAAETFVLGSSRSMKVEPAHVSRLTKKKAFNAAVNSGAAEDHYVMLQLLLQHARPKELVVGVDETAFHQTKPIDLRLYGTPVLARHLDTGDRLRGAWNQFKAALAFRTVVATARSLYYLATSYPARRVSVAADGALTFLAREAMIRDRTYDFAAELKKSKLAYHKRLTGFERLAPWRVDYFTRFVELAASEGIEVYLFLTPFHPETERYLRDHRVPLDQQRRAVRSLLEELSAKHGATFLDASDPETFGDDVATAFYDGAHPREELTERILERLLS